MNAFLVVYADLPREGPGSAEDVAWACAATGLRRDGRVCDLGCGSGADLTALREAVPEGSVLGLDLLHPFVAAAHLRVAGDPGITVRQGRGVGQDDVPDPSAFGPFDLIWSGGAIYFDGVARCLATWRDALAPGGMVAFSAPVVADPGDAEAVAFWGGDGWDTMASLDDAIEVAGYETVARGRVGDAGWRGYYAGLMARCDRLDGLVDAEIEGVIAAARREAAEWERLEDRIGYALRIVRPT